MTCACSVVNASTRATKLSFLRCVGIGWGRQPFPPLHPPSRPIEPLTHSRGQASQHHVTFLDMLLKAAGLECAPVYVVKRDCSASSAHPATPLNISTTH